MARLFSTLPLTNKLLNLAFEDALENGHYIDRFEKRKGRGLNYQARCTVCSANVYIDSWEGEYHRTGTAFTTKCRPG